MTERILKMPRLGETMDEGKVVGWLIQPGDSFKRGDAILEVETDKTIAELPALGDGRLNEVLVSIGDMVEIGKPLARIDIGEGPDWTLDEDEPANVPLHNDEETPSAEPPRTDKYHDDRVRATPVARRLARQHGLSLGAIVGTGRRGRVEKTDVLAVVDTGAQSGDVYFVTLRRGKMAYTDSGADSGANRANDAQGKNRAAAGRPLLLLHGFAGDHTTWAAVAAGLKRAGRRVLALDLPGHGMTEIQAQDASDLSGDLPEFLDALGIAEVDIVAHSLGAVAALDIAHAAPGRVGSLTLIAPAGLGSEIDSNFVHGMAHASAPGELAHLLRRLCARPVDQSQAALEALAKTLAQGRLVALAAAITSSRGGQKIDALAALNRLAGKVPLRVLVGLEDRIIPWQHVLALPCTVAVHLLARSGHMPQWDQSKEVLDILTA